MTNIKIIKDLKKNIFNLNRSLGGHFNYLTLKKIKEYIPALSIKKIKSRTNIYGWKVPYTWEVKKAYIKDDKNKKLIDIKNNFLHVLNYSTKIKKIISKKQLFKHLYFLKEIPNAIPYVTTYYYKKWGFCLKYNDLKKFKSKKYKVLIDSTFTKKGLEYGEKLFTGRCKKEIIFSTYICHPNLGNDNFSGIILNTLIGNYLNKKKLNYSYRLIFIPETIGSIYYIKNNLNRLKKNILAGYILSCLGRGKKINILQKYKENISSSLLNNFIQKNSYKHSYKNWEERGSDERQFCSPNINLPFSVITKNKFFEYKQYHTSLDDINYIKDNDILHSYTFFKKFIDYVEKQKIYLSQKKVEPFLSKYNLYSKISSSFHKNKDQTNLINVIDYCDGSKTITEISNILKIDIKNTSRLVKILLKNKLIKEI